MKRVTLALLALLVGVRPAAAQVNVPGQPVSTTSSPTFVNQTLTGKITLPDTTSSTVGTMVFGSDYWAHNFVASGTTGQNVFIGKLAGNFTLTGSSSGTQGSLNTGIGYNTLHAITTAAGATAVGNNAGAALTTGLLFTGVGVDAGKATTTGGETTAIGAAALQANAEGIRNTGIGAQALYSLVGSNDDNVGSNNTAVGDGAGRPMTTGAKNTLMGVASGYSGGGTNALTTGSSNTFLGYNGGLCDADQVSNSIALGALACANNSNETVIGNSSTTSVTIKGVPSNAAVATATFSNPTSTTSTSAVHAAIGGTITPTVTGRVLIIVTGTIDNATGTTSGSGVQLRYGTGTAPTNGTSTTTGCGGGPCGTAVGGTVQILNLPAAGRAPFTVVGFVTGLTLNTAYWLDISQVSITGGTTQIRAGSLTAIEL
jgi:hypothetical protein